MLTLDALRSRRGDILRIADRHGARNIRIFGSVARSETNDRSDLDVLVEMGRERDLIDLISIQQDLEDMLGCKVDVLTEAAISPYIRESIIHDAISL